MVLAVVVLESPAVIKLLALPVMAVMVKRRSLQEQLTLVVAVARQVALLVMVLVELVVVLLEHSQTQHRQALPLILVLVLVDSTLVIAAQRLAVTVVRVSQQSNTPTRTRH